MKKFLTVLLVIAVMFTFSFGSAFAVPADNTLVSADSARAKIEAEYNSAIAALDAQMLAAVNALFTGTAKTNNAILANGATGETAIIVSREVVEKLFKDEVYDAQKALIDAAYDQVCREVETMIAHADFVSFTTGTADGNAYPTFDITKYDYKALGDYASGVTNKVTAAAVFSIGTDNNSTVDGLEAKLAIAQFKAVKAAAEDAVNAIVVSEYSDKKVAGSEDTNREVAAKLVADALKDLTNLATPTNLPAAASGIAAVNAIYVAPVNQGKAGGNLFTGGAPYAPGLNNLLKVANESTAAADLEYAKTETLDFILAKVAADKTAAVKELNNRIRTEQSKTKVNAAAINALNKAIEDVTELYDAAVEVITYTVQNAETVAELGTINTSNIFVPGWGYVAGTGNYAAIALNNYVAVYGNAYVTLPGATAITGTATANRLKNSESLARVESVAEAKKAAEKAKIEVELDGSMAVEIEDTLADTIDDIYFNGPAVFVAPTNTTVVLARINRLIGGVGQTVKVNGKTYDTILDWNDEAGSNSTLNADYNATVNTVVSSYDKAKFDEIRAIVNETKAAVKAATTVEAADAAFLAGYAKFDAIPTATEHAAMFTTKAGALKADYDKYALLLNQLADGIEANIPTTITWIDANDLTGYVTTVTTDMRANCFTAEELKAAYEEAVATLSALKTDKELEAAKAEVEKVLKALPKTIAVADKAAVEAARKAYDAHADYVADVNADDGGEYGVSAYATSILTNAEKAIYDLEKKALIDELEPLAKKVAANTLTAADSAAVEALRTKVDAFVDYYATKNESNSRLDALEAKIVYGGRTLATVEGALDAVIEQDLVDMIAKLTVDPVDAAAVKAARAAFDEFTANGQLAFKMAHTASYDKLVALEKMITMDDEAAKAYVQDLSIKARSTKTSKGVKVTIKADVQELLDAGYTVEYKFYRSTKSNKGFKAMVTKTTGTYTNTKGVKGTKYYYKAKLVVKNAAGEVVATTPLTQCLYATRTF